MQFPHHAPLFSSLFCSSPRGKDLDNRKLQIRIELEYQQTKKGQNKNLHSIPDGIVKNMKIIIKKMTVHDKENHKDGAKQEKVRQPKKHENTYLPHMSVWTRTQIKPLPQRWDSLKTHCGYVKDKLGDFMKWE